MGSPLTRALGDSKGAVVTGIARRCFCVILQNVELHDLKSRKWLIPELQHLGIRVSVVCIDVAPIGLQQWGVEPTIFIKPRLFRNINRNLYWNRRQWFLTPMFIIRHGISAAARVGN